MILKNILRTLIGYLSSWYPNQKISSKKDLIIRNNIFKKIKKPIINRSELKKTHKIFNDKILLLLKVKMGAI